VGLRVLEVLSLEVLVFKTPHFNPRVEIVHVIAKNFNPVNRAEFNPRVR
jgi:hypothetical protein